MAQIQLDAGDSEGFAIRGPLTLSGVNTISGVTSLTSTVNFNSTETIAAGGTTTALDLTKSIHYVDADAGGDIVTLADGTNGQITTLIMASATGTLTATPANLIGGTSVTFNAAGDTVVLQFSSAASAWAIIGGNSYAVV